MPYRRTRVRRRDDLTQISWEQIEYLFSGYVLLPLSWKNAHPFSDDVHAASVWAKYKEGLVRLWFRGVESQEATAALCANYSTGRLFSRPWAWWTFDRPTARRDILTVTVPSNRTGREGWIDRRPTPTDVERIWAGNEPHFGAPRFHHGIFTVESEFSYLSRNGLLTQEEKQHASGSARKPRRPAPSQHCAP